MIDYINGDSDGYSPVGFSYAQKPRYRPWITASSLLRSSGDVVDGETAAQGCLCKSGCQVEHINRERGWVKPLSGENLPKIN
jgi:hypothetical protein